MGYKNTFKLLPLFVAISLIFVTCGGDDPASSDDPDPPAFPEFENIEADVSYFEQSSSKAVTENFNNAKSYALGLSSVSIIGQAYFSFFSSATTVEADYNDGEWRWEYSYSFEGQSYTVELVAQEISGSINWEMFLSYDDGQGNSAQDYKLVEGSVATDGSTGSWTFNSLDPENNSEIPVIETTWERFSDTNIEINTEFYDSGSGEVLDYTYTRDGSVYDMSYTTSNQENNIYIHWETDVSTGYYQVGTDTSNRYCWDVSFENANCSELGY